MGKFFSKLFASPERYEIGGRRIRVDRLRAEGGYSFVYQATDEDTHEEFALKKIVFTSPEAEHAAEAETRAFAQFQHPGLLPLVAQRTVDDARTPAGNRVRACLLLTPYYPGSLGDYMVSGATAPPEALWSEAKILAVFAEVLEAINVLHTASPPHAHRDIKPDNILLDLDGHPVVIDLGSIAPARVVVTSRSQALELQDEASRYCTAAFRAPELFDVPSDAVLDERVDTWALGATLFCLAFNALPFDGSYTSARAGVRIPQRHRFSPALPAIIARALTVDPHTRPTVAELLQQTRDAAAAL
eukprot:Amastigsp_a341977_47.p2 type:complete len:302 gc:universal Amastigsp_a341977_47:55-960(+)